MNVPYVLWILLHAARGIFLRKKFLGFFLNFLKTVFRENFKKIRKNQENVFSKIGPEICTYECLLKNVNIFIDWSSTVYQAKIRKSFHFVVKVLLENSKLRRNWEVREITTKRVKNYLFIKFRDASTSSKINDFWYAENNNKAIFESFITITCLVHENGTLYTF